MHPVSPRRHVRMIRELTTTHLPQGRTLPEAEWQRRHGGILALLWALAVAPPAYGVLRGHALSHDFASGALLAATAAVARRFTYRRALSSALTSRFRSAFEDGPIGMALVELTQTGLGTLLQVNRTLCAQFGRGGERLVGADLYELLDPASIADVRRCIDALVATELTVTHEEVRLLRHDDRGFDGRISMSLVAGAAGAARDLVLQVEDVTERNRLKHELQDLADHDPLTGLLNRRRFGLELAARLGSERRRGSAGAVILLDLDGFKEVNDTLGHEAGDALLIAVADALRSTSRAGDAVARLGASRCTRPRTTAARAASSTAPTPTHQARRPPPCRGRIASGTPSRRSALRSMPSRSSIWRVATSRTSSCCCG